MPATYEPIATTTLGSNVASYTFNSIPSTYTDLKLIAVIQRGSAGAGWYPNLQMNGLTSSVYGFILAQAYRQSNTDITSPQVGFAQTAVQTSQFDPNGASQWGLLIVDIPQYKNTNIQKGLFFNFSNAVDGTNSNSSFGGGIFASTNAISSLTVIGANYNLSAGSTLTLFGITAA